MPLGNPSDMEARQAAANPTPHSVAMSESPKKPERPKPEPKALTSEYHKARKQLVLWAGILLMWALVGVDLAKAEAMGGSIGAIITAIKSPQAVPWVLVILVSYFLFKATIEWFQCNLDRRKLYVSRIDFISAWVAALVAFSLYFGQIISNVRLADVFTYSTTVSLFLGLIAGFWIYSYLARLVSLRRQARLTMGHFMATSAVSLLILTLFVTVSYLVSRFFGTGFHWKFVLAGCSLFVIFFGGLLLLELGKYDWSVPGAKGEGEF